MFRLTYQVKNSSGYIYRGLPVIEDYEWVPDPTHAAG